MYYLVKGLTQYAYIKSDSERKAKELFLSNYPSIVYIEKIDENNNHRKFVEDLDYYKNETLKIMFVNDI